jgi:hypothetical protein
VEEIMIIDMELDGPLFRKQREILLTAMDRWRRGIAHVPAKADVERMEGLLNMLDEIADQAYDRYGIDCLLVKEEPR